MVESTLQFDDVGVVPGLLQLFFSQVKYAAESVELERVRERIC